MLKKIRNKLAIVNLSLSTALLTTMPIYADGTFDQASKVIGNVVGDFSSALKGIALIVGGAAATFCLVMTLISSNQRKVEEYRAWLLRICVVVIAIFALDFLFKSGGLLETIGKAFTK